MPWGRWRRRPFLSSLAPGVRSLAGGLPGRARDCTGARHCVRFGLGACRRARDLGGIVHIHFLLSATPPARRSVSPIPFSARGMSTSHRVPASAAGRHAEMLPMCSSRRSSSLADANRSCGVGSREPGTDVHVESQSACGLCQAPQADLLPPVPLVARHLLLSHAQELAELCLRKAASYARLGDEQTLVVLISVARLTIIPNTSTL